MANEAGDIIYGKGTNVQVADDEGNLHRATLVAPAPGEIVFNDPDTTSPNVMVADDEGNLHRATLVAAIGGFGGSDVHNKGWFVDDAALVEAYPTGEDGDYAFLGSTDTLWVWDSDNNEWVDTDRKGQVTSVNNQTGAVTVQETLVNQTNIKSVNGNSLLGSGNLEIAALLNYPASWPTTSSTTTKAFCDIVAADTTAVEGKMYLGEVRWSDLPSSLVNAECVVEIMKGTTSSNKVIVLTLTSGNTSPYMWKYTYWNGGSNVSGWIGFQPELPTQSGQSGKFLTTNGSALSWGSVDALPSQTGQSGKFLTTDGTDASWSDKPLVNTATGNYSLTILGGAASESNCVNIGVNSTVKQYSTVIGYFARSNSTHCIAIGDSSFAFGPSTIAIGPHAQAVANNSIQISTKNSHIQNLDANTVKIANVNGNFEIMSADGTIPTDRFTTTPVADGTYVPTITISSGTATRSWSAPAGGSTSATATLTVNDWSSNTQTVNVTGVTASNNVIVGPAPASQTDYTAAGIICTAQGSGTLTFTCTSVPSSAITVNVLII